MATRIPSSSASGRSLRDIRFLRRLRRHPLTFWVVAATLSLITGAVVTNMVGKAELEASRFGTLRPVLVATKHLPAGSELGPDNTELRSYPNSLVPEDALRTSVDGTITSADIAKGEEVLNTRLAPVGLSSTAALIPPGGRAIAVPTGAGSLAVEKGDRIDVLATIAPSPESVGATSSAPSAPTFPIAKNAVVISYTEESVTIGLSEQEAAKVAFALTAGVVTLVLNGATISG